MAGTWELGATTLPRPKKIIPTHLKTGVKATSLTGKTTEDVQNIKLRWALTFDFLSKTDYDNILSEYEAGTTKAFVVSDGDITINTTVHIDISSEAYTSGYKTNLTIVLTEEE